MRQSSRYANTQATPRPRFSTGVLLLLRFAEPAHPSAQRHPGPAVYRRDQARSRTEASEWVMNLPDRAVLHRALREGPLVREIHAGAPWIR